MAELQREFSTLTEELEGIKTQEKTAATLEKYKDYKFKVGTFGYKVEPEEKIEDATDADRETATRGKSGLVYSGFYAHSDHGYILMKEKSEYPRAIKVCRIIDAVEKLADDKVQDKEPYIKIVLGETDETNS
jgi:hypothetical protein